MIINFRTKIQVFLTVLGLFLILTMSCNKNTNNPKLTKTQLIAQKNWVLKNVYSLENQLISRSKLSNSGVLLFELEYQFRDNNQVKALEISSKSIVNGGVWEFSNNEKSIIINIPGLKDEFEVTELTSSKLILSPNPFIFPLVDKTTKVKMEFIPAN